MNYIYLITFILLALPVELKGQISIDLNNPYPQDFNTLPMTNGLWADDATLPGWYSQNKDGNNDELNASNGNSSGRLFSYGITDNNERSLGASPTNTSGDIVWGVRFKNNTELTIQSIKVNYRGEQWRVSENEDIQLITFSYKVSNGSINDVDTDETGSGYTQVPELNFISPKMDVLGINLEGGNAIGIDGNSAEFSNQISYTFNVTVLPDEEIMLRFFNTNHSQYDYGLSVDDLEVSFFLDPIEIEIFQGETTTYQFIGGSIQLRIPDETSLPGFALPSNDMLATFREIFLKMLIKEYSEANSLAKTVGYLVTRFEDEQNAQVHYILRHNGIDTNENYWGTFIFNDNPGEKGFVNFSIPHPLFDSNTAQQGGYIYQNLQAGTIQIAGIHRCASTLPGCAGSTSVCDTDGYKISDVAHEVGSVFHIGVEEIANYSVDNVFVQLHGFSAEINDPGGIVSNGTEAVYEGADLSKNFTEFINGNYAELAVLAQENLEIKLKAFSNVQGRFLNGFEGNICTDEGSASTPSNRFMHIEQKMEGWRDGIAGFEMVLQGLNSIFETILPVELQRFSAHLENREVRLLWSTASEYNNERFEIERSLDGIRFETLYSISGFGTSTSMHQYAFVDKLPANGSNYYRLKQVDFDGRYSYSSVVFVFLDPNAEIQVQLYPNPTFDRMFNLDIIGTENGGSIILSVFDKTGKLLETIEYSKGGIQLPKHWCAGFYNVHIQFDDKMVILPLILQD